MAYKRALWHSGLTYRHHCRTCGTEFTYTDKNLDFRPWYADGFVYCPKCKNPLRHSEMLAIGADGQSLNVSVQTPAEAVQNETTESSGGTIAYCSNCGAKYNVGAQFCASCGNKLD
ncbi:MAG: zinc-ribbon domain-containing protein [Lachnospiraceae bacterium]|jgi:predicted amidophosphoribosyltransferase